MNNSILVSTRDDYTDARTVATARIGVLLGRATRLSHVLQDGGTHPNYNTEAPEDLSHQVHCSIRSLRKSTC